MKRLGQILTDLEWISPSGLAQALATQEVLGGRLGTCMLEVQAVSEERLMAGLVRQLQVPAARSRDLTRIPTEVLSLVPVTKAVESQAVPFRMLGDELHVALLDVHDRILIQDLEDLCAKRILPFIANEARLFRALDEGYDCGVSARFEQLIRQLDVGDNGSAVTAMSQPPTSLGEVLEALAAVRDRDEVADLLLHALGTRFEHAALFVSRRSRFRGWRGTGPDFDPQRLADLDIDPEAPSALSGLVSGAPYHAGPLTPNETHRAIADVWAGQVPLEALVVPVHVADRLAMAIWCTAAPGELTAQTVQEIQQIAAATGDALARLIAQQRERSAST